MLHNETLNFDYHIYVFSAIFPSAILCNCTCVTISNVSKRSTFEKFNILELEVELSEAAKGLEVKLENAQKSNKKESNLPA